ncbi:MAG: alpha/beta fold hydrolase [Kiritimatiellae bacterium]|jgi:carboxylesterase|nr:alpha/beta fold hydrolase [Kiritimatiellia bacterium]
MNKQIRIIKWLRRLLVISGGLFLLPLCSCAVFTYRYNSWDKNVTRTPEGVLEFAQASTRGHGDNALLLVHGFGDGPHVWNHLAPELARKGYTVRAMRLPGWNEPIETKRNITLDDWERAIQRELVELNDTHNKVGVLAHSMGGCLVTVLAQKNQLDADALVLYAPMFEVSSARSPILKTSTWFKIGDTILPERMIIESMFADHARVNKPRPKTRRDPFSPLNIFRLLYADMDRFDAQTPSISIPVRLVLPGKDRVVHSPRSRQWFDSLRAESKTLHEETPAGHVLPLDVDVLAEVDRLTIWLSEQGIAP